MKYETSYELIKDSEKEVWEDLIKGSVELLDILNAIDPNQLHVAKYINVLFGIRLATDGYKALEDIMQEVYSGYYTGYRVDTYSLQKIIKHYLGDIDSTLDYLHKFLNGLKLTKKNKIVLPFDRETETFAGDINHFRNTVMHDGVPAISFDKRSNPTCHAHVAGSHNVHCVIWVQFNTESGGDSKQLNELLRNTYHDTKKRIQEINDILISKLSGYKDIKVE